MQFLSQRLASKPVVEQIPGSGKGVSPARQRERLLDATEHLIAARGCASTSIEMIVKGAKVSSVTFYEYFKGKEECFVAAFDRAAEEVEADIARELARGPDAAGLSWAEGVMSGLGVVTRLLAADPERARFCVVEAPAGPLALRARYDAALDQVTLALRGGRGLDTAPSGLPSTHEEATAGAIAWVLREHLEAGGEDAEALHRRLVEIALGPYRGDG